MSDPSEKVKGEPERFTEEELACDPSRIMRRVETNGSVLITDADGKPRMRISAPGGRPLVLD